MKEANNLSVKINMEILLNMINFAISVVLVTRLGMYPGIPWLSFVIKTA